MVVGPEEPTEEGEGGKGGKEEEEATVAQPAMGDREGLKEREEEEGEGGEGGGRVRGREECCLFSSSPFKCSGCCSSSSSPSIRRAYRPPPQLVKIGRREGLTFFLASIFFYLSFPSLEHTRTTTCSLSYPLCS